MRGHLLYLFTKTMTLELCLEYGLIKGTDKRAEDLARQLGKGRQYLCSPSVFSAYIDFFLTFKSN